MSKIIFYRNKCIGCSICHEMQPEVWRMSKKDGKAVLLKAIEKKEIHQFSIPEFLNKHSIEVAEACPAKVIKIV